jgi:hypothetical protein
VAPSTINATRRGVRELSQPTAAKQSRTNEPRPDGPGPQKPQNGMRPAHPLPTGGRKTPGAVARAMPTPHFFVSALFSSGFDKHLRGRIQKLTLSVMQVFNLPGFPVSYQ